MIIIEDVCLFQEYVRISYGKQSKHFGTIEDANNYFSMKFNSFSWIDLDFTQKTNALIEATQIIYSLQFQDPEIRDEALHTNNPYNIVKACYEIAIKIVEGYDRDIETNFRITANVLGNVKTTYSDRYLPEHIRAGIPSYVAWLWIKPYLIDPLYVQISRES